LGSDVAQPISEVDTQALLLPPVACVANIANNCIVISNINSL
jgi:hypothetical protein